MFNDLDWGNTQHLKFNTQHSTLNIPLKVQLLLYQFADSFYSFALALDVFMNIIAHGIDVVEEIGKGRLIMFGLRSFLLANGFTTS